MGPFAFWKKRGEEHISPPTRTLKGGDQRRCGGLLVMVVDWVESNEGKKRDPSLGRQHTDLNLLKSHPGLGAQGKKKKELVPFFTANSGTK